MKLEKAETGKDEEIICDKEKDVVISDALVGT